LSFSPPFRAPLLKHFSIESAGSVLWRDIANRISWIVVKLQQLIQRFVHVRSVIAFVSKVMVFNHLQRRHEV